MLFAYSWVRTTLEGVTVVVLEFPARSALRLKRAFCDLLSPRGPLARAPQELTLQTALESNARVLAAATETLWKEALEVGLVFGLLSPCEANNSNVGAQLGALRRSSGEEDSGRQRGTGLHFTMRWREVSSDRASTTLVDIQARFGRCRLPPIRACGALVRTASASALGVPTAAFAASAADLRRGRGRRPKRECYDRIVGSLGA